MVTATVVESFVYISTNIVCSICEFLVPSVLIGVRVVPGIVKNLQTLFDVCICGHAHVGIGGSVMYCVRDALLSVKS